MMIEVDDLRFVDEKLQVKKHGEWLPQYCPFVNGPLKPCTLYCPLCTEMHSIGDGQVHRAGIVICQDRKLVPRIRRKTEETKTN